MQIPTSIELYPFRQASFQTFLDEIDMTLSTPEVGNKELLIEPNLEEYMKELRRQIRNYVISSALLQNKTGEHAARMIAMKNAKDNATEFSKKLKLNFNKARQ
jgi:F-type H+-transporting ATPase subunit gamma